MLFSHPLFPTRGARASLRDKGDARAPRIGQSGGDNNNARINDINKHCTCITMCLHVDTCKCMYLHAHVHVNT